MRAGAILLVGGRSSRMGRAKAALDWHGEPLAARVARVLARSVEGGPVVAVAAPGQALPPLPDGVALAFDPAEGAGPLQALAVGLAALAGRADVAFASSVDAPLLHTRFVRAVLAALPDGDDAAVPVAHGHRQPLAAAYRTGLAPLAATLLADGERGLGALLAAVRTRFLDEDELRRCGDLAAVDPALDALRNVNTAEEYEAARRHPWPDVAVEVRGTGSRTVPAVRLADLAAAVGLQLDRDVAVEVDGERVPPDPWFPLGRGDRVTLAPGRGNA